MNSNIDNDGRNAKVPTFTTVGDQTGVKLSDLSVTGYQDTEGGCWGNVYIGMLTKMGATKKLESGLPVSYLWFDAEDEYEAGWYDYGEAPLKDDESELGNADEIVFDVGEAFTIFADSEYIGCKVISAGEVFAAALSYPIANDGRNMMGNPLPVAIKLSKIYVTGYEDTEGGCWGNVYIGMLTKMGATKKLESGLPVSYLWFDAEDEYEAGWYDYGEAPLKDDESELGNADEITFEAGEGFTVFADSEYIGCTVEFPNLVNINK